MTTPQQTAATRWPRLQPMIYCSDETVQRFVRCEMLNFDPGTTMASRQLFQAARDKYGDLRCDSLE